MSMLEVMDNSSAGPVLQATDILRLRHAIRGDLVLPDDAGYDPARKVWNGMVDKRPAAVMYCADADDGAGAEGIRHVNRIKGLLFSQGVSGYEPLKVDPRKCLDVLTTGDGRPLSSALMAQISRELDRIELLIQQIKELKRHATPCSSREICQHRPCCSASTRKGRASHFVASACAGKPCYCISGKMS